MKWYKWIPIVGAFLPVKDRTGKTAILIINGLYHGGCLIFLTELIKSNA